MSPSIWRYNKTTGYWVHCRTCEPETAPIWLEVWQADEPNETFKISKSKPSAKSR